MINSVRNTVQTILNKNNYGYISPSDFNLLAQNAQMEIFEEYFSSFNKTINAENMRSSGTEYADIAKPISEVLESFLLSDFIVPRLTNPLYTTNNFYVPSLTTVGNNAYMINKVIVFTNKIVNGTTTATNPFWLADATKNFIALGVKVGDVAFNTSTNKSATIVEVFTTQLILDTDIFKNVSFGEKYSVYSGTKYSEAEKVNNSKILLLQNSLLTNPSLTYPAYTNISDYMTLYPTTINGYGAVRCDYFRYPKVPKWTYTTIAGGEPIFDQSQPDYQDFELPTEDEYKLVTKMLEYCGIVIREIEVSQFGTAQQQHEQPTFSMQQ
jgi:hypothetical protein